MSMVSKMVCKNSLNGRKRALSVILVGALLVLTAYTVIPIEGSEEFSESGELLWTYDTDLYVRHVETADLNGDGIADAIACEYDSNLYDEPSKVYAINGVDGSTLWTYMLNDGVRSMTIGDINNDGVMDVIAGASMGSSTPDGKLHAIDGTDGSEIWVYTPSQSGGYTIGDVAIGNFDGDEYPDVAVACWDDYVYAVSGADGTELWNAHIGSIFVNAVDTGDVNGDGIDDVAFAHSYLLGYDNYLGVLDGTDGSVIWESTVDYEALNVILSDIDDDGNLEAVFGVYTDSDESIVQVRDAATGNIEWEYTLGTSQTSPDICLFSFDIDNDGDLDLIVGNRYVDEHIVAFDGDSNTPMWISEDLNGCPRDLAFADINGDGFIEIAAATYDRIQILNAISGTKKWYYPVDGTVASVSCGDLDGDGIKDVVGSGGAGFSGSDPSESVWALRTTDISYLLWEFGIEGYGNALVIADLNGDPCMDVAAVTSYDKVWAINGEDGTELWHWESTDNLYAVTSGDFNGDGQIDIAVAGADQRVTALDGSDGSIIWQFTEPSDQIYRRCLQAADLNGDGKDDVAVGSDDEHVYAVDGSSGSELWSISMGGDIEEVELAQMDGSGPLDVVVAVGHPGNKVAVIDGSNGEILWEYTENIEDVKHVEAMDVNGDGVTDIAIGVPPMGSNPGKVVMVDGETHQEIWSINTPIGYEYCLSHGDLNGDGIPDVVVGGSLESKKVFAYDGQDGSELWSFTTNGEINVVCVSDVDNSGTPDVVAGSTDQYVYVLRGNNGENVWSYAAPGDVKHAQVGDISGDNKPNIAIVTFDSDGVVDAFISLTGIPLQAEADGPYEGMANTSIQFHGSASGGTPPYTWHWDFGDGGTSDEQNPTYVYTTPGNYIATLTVTDSGGNTSQDTTTVKVYGELSVDADGPYNGTIGELIQFYGSATGGKPPYSWHWDFGDGYTTDVQNPVHRYWSQGTYEVVLTVTDSLGNKKNDTTTATITPAPLVADANGPYEGVVGEPVQFHGSAQGGIPPYTWEWDFGDGGTSDEQNPAHVYSESGTYTVILTVTDSENREASSETTVIIHPAEEIVADANGPYEGIVGEAIQFHGSVSGGTPPYTWHWDFGDGGTSDEQNPIHIYRSPGTYTITLRVVDSNGKEDTDTTYAVVYSEDVLIVDANGPYEGIVGEAIQFHGFAQGGTPPYTWEWDFGDGGTSNEQNPTHVYSRAGTYVVILTVTDSEGHSNMDQTTVTVRADATPPTVDIIKPKPNSLYLMNHRILPFIGTIVIGKIDIEVNATDNTGVTSVEFYVDSVLVSTDSSAPYKWTWSDISFFRHIIRVVAYDIAGNQASREVIVWKFF